MGAFYKDKRLFDTCSRRSNNIDCWLQAVCSACVPCRRIPFLRFHDYKDVPIASVWPEFRAYRGGCGCSCHEYSILR